jgi:hypothetical protein
VCDVVFQRGFLCNMVADNQPNQLRNCNYFLQGFADDVVILISGKLFSDLMQRT